MCAVAGFWGWLDASSSWAKQSIWEQPCSRRWLATWCWVVEHALHLWDLWNTSWQSRGCSRRRWNTVKLPAAIRETEGKSPKLLPVGKYDALSFGQFSVQSSLVGPTTPATQSTSALTYIRSPLLSQERTITAVLGITSRNVNNIRKTEQPLAHSTLPGSSVSKPWVRSGGPQFAGSQCAERARYLIGCRDPLK